MKFIYIVVLGALVVTASGAFAQTTINTSGTASGKSDSEVTALSDTHLIVKSETSYDTMKMADPDHPYNGMSGKCHGSFEMQIPSATGGGHCVFSDDSGSQTVTRFTVSGMAADGALTGTWAVVGGTGKFAGSTGGGTFHSLTDTATGMFENKIVGAMVMQ